MFGFNRELDKAATQALHLFFCRRPEIVRRSHCTQPPGGRNRLQSRDTGANHKYPRGCNRSRSGGKHGENSRKGISRDQDSFITADGSHGRKCVHALCARGSRHQFNGKRSHTGAGDLLKDLHRTKRPQKSNQDLPAAHQWKICLPSNVIGAVAEDLHHNIGRAEYCGAVGQHAGAFLDIRTVREARLAACLRFDYDFKTRF